jgi:ferric-dicitrate binding protein FerR (iron transport regulator)
MDQEKLADLIKRYNAGLATAEEIAILDEIWRNADNEMSFEADHSPEELDSIEGKMFNAIANHKSRRVASSLLISPQFLYKAAATALIFLSVSLWWYANSNDFTEIQNGFGKRLTVTLPDQSTVLLNGNSILRYSKDWDKSSAREVWIEGEGFFSIVHTKDNQKFIVHADNQLQVEVLGTKFNVKARHQTSEVMLAEGKVKLGLGEGMTGEEVILKPGELAIVKNETISKRAVKQRKYTSWVDNKLFFERTPLSELAVLMRDTYGLTVRFDNPNLEKRELSGEISSATADDVLYAIAATLDLDIEREGSSAIISSRRN